MTRSWPVDETLADWLCAGLYIPLAHPAPLVPAQPRGPDQRSGWLSVEHFGVIDCICHLCTWTWGGQRIVPIDHEVPSRLVVGRCVRGLDGSRTPHCLVIIVRGWARLLPWHVGCVRGCMRWCLQGGAPDSLVVGSCGASGHCHGGVSLCVRDHENRSL